MALPTMTNEQRTEALEKANQTRKERAEIRKKIGDGKLTIQDVFTMSDEGNTAAAKMRVTQLLNSFPRIGRVKAEKIVDRCDISRTRRVQGLGTAQRRKLIEAFG